MENSRPPLGWPSDDDVAHLEPIDGVSLERYAQLTREMAQAGVVGPDAIEQFVGSRGVVAGAWSRIAAGWSSRMVRDEAIRLRFDELLSRNQTGS